MLQVVYNKIRLYLLTVYFLFVIVFSFKIVFQMWNLTSTSVYNISLRSERSVQIGPERGDSRMRSAVRAEQRGQWLQRSQGVRAGSAGLLGGVIITVAKIRGGGGTDLDDIMSKSVATVRQRQAPRRGGRLTHPGWHSVNIYDWGFLELIRKGTSCLYKKINFAVYLFISGFD